MSALTSSLEAAASPSTSQGASCSTSRGGSQPLWNLGTYTGTCGSRGHSELEWEFGVSQVHPEPPDALRSPHADLRPSPRRPTPPPHATLPDQYRGRVQVSPSDSHSAISLGTRWPRRKPTASRESRGLETELAISGPPQVLTIWGTVGFRGDHARRPPTPPPPPPSPLRPRLEGDAWPSWQPKVGTCLPRPQPEASPAHCSAHACRPHPPTQPRHQVQRPEEEVHELSSAGVLDVFLQLGLEWGGWGRRGMSRWQTDRWAGGPQGQHRGCTGGRGGAAGLTSRLMASLVFWKQSINWASDGGRARSVRTPSAMWGRSREHGKPCPCAQWVLPSV